MVVAATAATAVSPAAAPAPVTPAAASTLAANSAANLVAGKPAFLHAGSEDKFVQRSVISSAGLQFVPYERTYRDLRVLGGDFVIVTNSSGQVTATSSAQEQTIEGLSTSPKLTKAQAEKVAKGQLKTVSGVESTDLVVYALDGAPRLAYESTVRGTSAEGVSRLTIDVDALTGAVLKTRERVMEGTGTGWINGSVTISTTLSGSTYSMTDPGMTTLKCQDAANNTTFSGSDDVWGNGTGTNKETGCVDALYVAQQEKAMLSNWLGRNGFNGSGGAWPIRVGLNDQNAYYDGTQVQIGKNTAGQWISSADVVGHELGHGIDDTTPGGISNGNTQEFVADVFGAATEAYANNPNDPRDYQVGEEINLVGSGPIRYMYNPSLAGDDNCYSSSIPGEEVHAAAGPGNHWFYLLAEGTNPTNGQPTSTTCNGSSGLVGVGIQTATKIMYNAMLMKTSTSSYLKYRTWTLTAAKALDATCGLFNKTKAAWDAVSVPAQSGDPTCTGGSPSPTPTATGGSPSPTPTSGTCSGQKLGNPGFETGSASPWTATSGVVDSSASEAAHSGSWKAWLDGYGTTHTDTLQQAVTIPAGCHATLTYWLHIDTSETTTTVQYDKLTVTVNGASVATYSNLNKASGYTLRTIDISAYAGGTATLKFTGTEDASLQTSFVIDDTAITLS
ncbi:MAG: M4 family metallopeptidase [Hamadaea sp.]|uniref:M4 family metallopeptidase n=1 Tax=Hamadaea sp. TaxID=2024425 RepID=UPI00184CAB1F|nr:M4 family metallopeptidase [Hamadaea sp.]NUR69636.1 M4 family metallopeptidase [Hamadaea sp.]NUT23342.1 M4 family metallopeptidase [Hamadaea sp.]